MSAVSSARGIVACFFGLTVAGLVVVPLYVLGVPYILMSVVLISLIIFAGLYWYRARSTDY